MSESIVLIAPGVLSAPLPGTPILPLPGDVTVLAADAFTGVDGALVHGRATTPPPGRAALLWETAAATRLSAGTLVNAAPPLTGVTYVTIPDGEPPAEYEVSFKIVSALGASTFIDLFRNTTAPANASDKIRLAIDGDAMTAKVSNIKDGIGVTYGTPFPFAWGDILGLRAHQTAGTVSALKNGTVVQSYTGQPAQPGRMVGVAYATSTWAVDDFRLVQTLD